MRVNGTMYFEEQLSAAKLEAKSVPQLPSSIRNSNVTLDTGIRSNPDTGSSCIMAMPSNLTARHRHARVRL